MCVVFYAVGERKALGERANDVVWVRRAWASLILNGGLGRVIRRRCLYCTVLHQYRL